MFLLKKECCFINCDCQTQKMTNVVVDFFYVRPGEGVSRRCAEHILSLLNNLGIGQKILATVCDNGSDAIATAALLSDMMAEQ